MNEGEARRLRDERSALYDALGRPISSEGDLRVRLDDDIANRPAPPGWIHLITARECCFLLLTGRVVELELDNDLGDDQQIKEFRFGIGFQVVDFLYEQHYRFERHLWPRDGITIHTGNAAARDRMRTVLDNLGRRLPVNVSSSYGANTQATYVITKRGDD